MSGGSRQVVSAPRCAPTDSRLLSGSSEARSVPQGRTEQAGQSEVAREECPRPDFLTPLEDPVLHDVPVRGAQVLVSKSHFQAVVF